MQLSDCLAFSNIAIQCHDNPDADALASGFGLRQFFTAAGKTPRFFFSGPVPITKPNLREMIRLLDIPVEHLARPPRADLLITVDCRHGSGNVTPAEAGQVCVIDHHLADGPLPEMHDVRPYLASCSTLVWRLLLDEGFQPDTRLATALYYGLLTDSLHFKELSHPLDRDLRDIGDYDRRTIRTLTHCNLALADLALTATGLHASAYAPEERNLVVAVPACDPNILGFIGDLVMQVDGVDSAVVFSDNGPEVKFSVRSVTRELKASHLAAWIARGRGSGGGLADKAGGRLNPGLLPVASAGLNLPDFFRRQVADFIQQHPLLDCSVPDALRRMIDERSVTPFADFSRLAEYVKQPVELACVAGLFSEPTKVHVRMLEGDITLTADADTYFMIGLEGEVYPISRAKFEATYLPGNGQRRAASGYKPVRPVSEYKPVLLDMEAGTKIDLERHAQRCTARGGGGVRAVRLDSGLRLFTSWDPDSYMQGEPGDWLVIQPGETLDCYVVKGALFPALYGGMSA